MAQKSLADRIAELRRQERAAAAAVQDSYNNGQMTAQEYQTRITSPVSNSGANLSADAYESLDTNNRNSIQAAYDRGDITSQYYDYLMATPQGEDKDGAGGFDKLRDWLRDTPDVEGTPSSGNGSGSGGSGGGSGASNPLSTDRNLIAPLANYDPAAYESYVAAMQALDAARGQAPIYNDTYGDQLNALYAEITGRDPFKYDLDSDPLYQQYRDQYMMQGQQAMMDTMGQAAALTGGYGSTYSQAVGQQQYNAYLQDLNQIVPDLYQNAYNRWLSEGDRLTQQYGILSDLSDRDYGMYRDKVSDYWTGVDYAQQQADLEYNRGLAEWERDYQLNEDARAQQAADYDRLLQLMQMGYAPNADEIRAAGMSEAEAAAWQKFIKSQQSGGGGGYSPLNANISIRDKLERDGNAARDDSPETVTPVNAENDLWTRAVNMRDSGASKGEIVASLSGMTDAQGNKYPESVIDRVAKRVDSSMA